MHLQSTVLPIAVAALLLLHTADAYTSYAGRIPNGNRVPSPCQDGTIWAGVGHQSSAGGNARNPFGLDFVAAGLAWTKDLCKKDSDGDGLTNGQELGDPDCIWTPGATPTRSTGLSHPGICPLSLTTCINSWTVCPKTFNCPALTEPGVTMRNFTIKSNTPVPAKETTYICQAFELNSTATPVHMIGSRPIIINQNVMHHMIMYACSVRPEQKFFDAPQECFMGRADCTEILNLWGFGVEGECFNSNAGFRIGGEGFRYAIMEVHWNNPDKRIDYTDGSGFSLYYTSSLRKYDQGTLMYGELNLVLPPRQAVIAYNHTCPSVCTDWYHNETRYITGAVIHMHTFGIKGRISLWRNGSLMKDLSPLQVYDYNSPQMISFDPPIEYRKGDEVKTECYFSTLRSNKTIFYGEGTGDEMCFAFLSYYPNNVSLTTTAKLSQCIGFAGINWCWLNSGVTPQVEQGCNITGMMRGDIPNKVLSEMFANKCFSRTGCDTTCRDYLNNTLWPANACYDPKRARQMTETLVSSSLVGAPINQTIANTLYGQRFCEQEITMLADMARQAGSSAAATTAGPTPQTGQQPARLTSEHLLIIIIVCSCLGFVLVLAGLGVLASKISGSGSGGGHAGCAKQVGGGEAPGITGEDRLGVYKVYDNAYDSPTVVHAGEKTVM